MTGPQEWLAALEADGAVIAATPAEHLARPVPTCPDWSVHDLIVHLGAVHRWAATFLAAGPDSKARFAFDASDAPEGPEITDWYRERLGELVAELRRHDPAEPARGFAGHGTVGFWYRRQAHEAAVHRWDVQNATGEPTPIEVPLAEDGVDEWLEIFVPRFLARGAGLPADSVGSVLHLHGVDESEAEWTITFGTDGVKVGHAHARGDAAVRGTASELFLAMWRRVPLDALEVHGDGSVPQTLLDAVVVT
ncbi:maleylpyruvate isomerase family mycothiol-dependent enzyme [Tsukamurella sp. 8F]|uniref:maleylpyruvate isomerase family mycothiol-dependent enzyme n=1 Tax=unclassified Tsukamurella TaxID=2633480 RepID=UPI0023B94430|nr:MULTISPECIES: maleylpyruvate isomerase family mycothiol-dependent enzyme [unclassified Tsukamurella]MDF0529747.1 maleylpyruvate isomerase family mycothiol-dependent enzyme [Tsukamurella sp. 8J]MDF0586032.1 maleylpyruvate isomerase family mycothiol-dependent enzyme [Tsukamurella sp. 8F]